MAALPRMIGNFTVNGRVFAAQDIPLSRIHIRSCHQSRVFVTYGWRKRSRGDRRRPVFKVALDMQHILRNIFRDACTAGRDAIFCRSFQTAIRAWRSIAAREESAKFPRTARGSSLCASVFRDAPEGIDRSVRATVGCMRIAASYIGRPATPARRWPRGGSPDAWAMVSTC